MKKNMKKIVLFSFLIMAFICFREKIYAVEEGYQFTCFYDDFFFDLEGVNKRNLQVDIYENDVRIYIKNGDETLEQIKNGDTISSHIKDYKFGDALINFDKKNTLFYTDGKATCPPAKVDYSQIGIRSSFEIDFDINTEVSNPSSSRENSPRSKVPTKSGLTPEEQEEWENQNSDLIELECKDYYYEPNSYDEKIFNYHFFFDITKYKSGKIEISIHYGDYNDTIQYNEGDAVIPMEIGGHKFGFQNLGIGNMNSCPSKSAFYFCESNEYAYIVTGDKKNCLFEEDAVKTTDKATAEESGQIHAGASIGGQIQPGLLSCDNLGSDTIDFLKSAFTLVKVAAIVIAIAVSIFDFISATSKDKDVLMETVRKVSIRMIIVIAIVILPTLINAVGGILGYDDIVCGIL